MGARINAGLDIINVLSEFYDFAPPIFIDQAESITNLLPTRGQQIRLIVSEADPVLRFGGGPRKRDLSDIEFTMGPEELEEEAEEELELS